MAAQRIFKSSYTEELRGNIDPLRYQGDTFDYDPTFVTALYGVTHPEGLVEQMIPTRDGDFVSAKVLFEAYNYLTPLQAQYDSLWVYLSHVDLFSYVKSRWPFSVSSYRIRPEKYIQDHWFGHRIHSISSISGLWWSIYQTIDMSRDNPYELSELLFKSYALRDSGLMTLPSAAHGILEFFVEHKDIRLTNKVSIRCLEMFNIIIASKNPSGLSKEFFKNALSENVDNLIGNNNDDASSDYDDVNDD